MRRRTCGEWAGHQSPLSRSGRGGGVRVYSSRRSRHPDVLILLPHPQPFSLREKGVKLPSPALGEGPGVRVCSPRPVGEGPGVRACSPLPVGEWPGVRICSPRPVGEGPGVRVCSPRCSRHPDALILFPHPPPWTLALFENARFLLQTGTNSCRFGEYL